MDPKELVRAQAGVEQDVARAQAGVAAYGAAQNEKWTAQGAVIHPAANGGFVVVLQLWDQEQLVVQPDGEALCRFLGEVEWVTNEAVAARLRQVIERGKHRGGVLSGVPEAVREVTGQGNAERPPR